MSRKVASAAWVLQHLPIELVERIIGNILSSRFAWISGETLHIQGWFLLHHNSQEEVSACYATMQLGLVSIVRLTTYIIEPSYNEGILVAKRVNLLTKNEF